MTTTHSFQDCRGFPSRSSRKTAPGGLIVLFTAFFLLVGCKMPVPVGASTDAIEAAKSAAQGPLTGDQLTRALETEDDCDCARGVECGTRRERLQVAMGPPGGGGGRFPVPSGKGGGLGRFPAPGSLVPQGPGAANLPPAADASEIAGGQGPAAMRPVDPTLSAGLSKTAFSRFTQGLPDVTAREPFILFLRPFPVCPLPRAELASIDAHPLAAHAQLTGLGEGLVFLIEQYIPMGPNQSSRMEWESGILLGETIQAQLLARIIARIYPKAKIGALKSDYKPGPGTKKVYLLGVTDHAETRLKTRRAFSRTDILKLGEDNHAVEMVALKTVNSSHAALSRKDARQLLGVSPDSQVLSVYGNDVLNAMALVAKLATERNPQTIFFSPSYVVGSKSEGALNVSTILTKALPPDWHVAQLSHLSPKDIGGGKLVVVVDLKGVQPYVNAAANHLFILGTINPLEGLAVGTPTTIVFSGVPPTTYNLAMMQYMHAIALGTGGASIVTTIDEASAESLRLEKLIIDEKRKIIPPYAVVGPDKVSAIDAFLSHLQRVLEKQDL